MRILGPEIRRGLAFRIIAPVILLTLVIGMGMTVFVLRGASTFADGHIRENLEWVAHDVYDICDRNLNELIRSGLSTDERAERVRRGLTLGVIEDFLRQTAFGGIVYLDPTEELLMSRGVPVSPSDLISKVPQENHFVTFRENGQKYFAYRIRFEPWRWHIVLVKDVGGYSSLVGKITLAYAATGAILLLSALVLIVTLNASVREPIRRIIEPIAAGAAPSYKGITEFEFLSDSIRQMMASLHEKTTAQRRLATAIEQAGEAIIVTETDGTIVYVNPAFEQITGYSRDEATGKNPRILRSGRHDAAFYESLWATIARGGLWKGRLTNRRKDGSLYEEEAAISPVRDSAGAIVNYVAVKRDITREAGLEAQLRQTQKMEAVGRLAGGIAHDINNSLGAITGFSELVRLKRPDDADVVKKMASIIEISAKASALIEQLLAFSRRQPVKAEVLSLNDAIGRIEMMMKRVLGERIRLDLAISEGLWDVRVDPSQVEQVLVNLIVNAREAMPGGGVLSIGTENVRPDGEADSGRAAAMPPGEYVQLTVADTGVGIPEEIRERIFEPFFTTKESGKGSGLGLSTVYAIVRQNGGFVFVESAVGEGATFRICLPRYRPAGESSREEAPESDAGKDGFERILLVEDNDDVRESTRSILRAMGYDVVTAAGGAEALEIFDERDEDFDLVVTDVVMPGMSGRELAERLRERSRRLAILFISGFAYDVIANQGEFGEGIAFLQKPFSARELVRKMREALGKEERDSGGGEGGPLIVV